MPLRADEESATLQHPRLDEGESASATFRLVVSHGPDAGAQLLVDESRPGPLLVGQSGVCALQLSDRAVSRRHVALEVVGGALRVTDLDSTNGSRVNGLRIKDVFLEGGEVLEIGGTRIEISRQADLAPSPLPSATQFGRVLGQSVEMRRLYPLLDRLAASTIPVIIEGETGTGKEILAEAIHEQGIRAGGPFVVFDCTAVPANLMEAELFGHERGAFTGAVGDRRGFFEQAHGGTLLIDEIGDLDPQLQPKLLRAIERAEIRRVGSERALRVDVRIVAATRRDLDHEVQEGRFRDDLFHRLAVARVELPPLRRRRGDILLLARHFWAQLGGDPKKLSNALIQRWDDYSWPGNVRELRNAVARRIALGELSLESPVEETTAPAAEPAADLIGELLRQRLPLPLARRQLRAEFERRYVEQMLADHDGNVSKAAAASGIARRYFQMVRARIAKP